MEDRVRRELLNMLYRDQPLGLTSAWIFAMLIGVILGTVHESPVPWCWMVAMTSVTGIRLGIARSYWRTPEASRNGSSWEMRLLVGACLTGLGWGFFGWYAYPVATPMLRGAVVLLIGGTATGASRTLSCHPASFFAYLVTTTVPLLVRMFRDSQPSALLLASFAVLYVVMMLGLGYSFHRTFTNAFRLQFENADLAAHLTRDIAAREAAESALHASEEWLRLAHYALDRAQDPVAILDRDGNFLYASEAMCRFTGRTAQELAVAKVWEVTTTLAGEFELTWDHVKHTGALTFETLIRGRNGIAHEVEVNASFFAFNGREAICTISRDLAPRRAAEHEKVRLQHQLQETQRLESLGVLAGGMAHDFNNLLTAILGNATMARESLADSAAVGGMLTQIEKASTQAAGLCRQMLAYAGRGQLSVEALDVSSVVTDTARLLEMSAGRQTRLKLQLSAGLPRVLADASQLRQIVLNLVHNAAEAITHANGEITVSTLPVRIDARVISTARVRSDLPEGDGVEISVRDNGSGISPRTLDRIFEPFFTTKSAGRGLGLAAVLGIVQSHRALLLVESTPGKGTTFRVIFEASNAAAQQVLIAPVKVGCAGGRVLVIDDDEAVRNVARQVLERLDLTVETAADGESAVALCEKNADRFNLLLVDMTMPGIDGITALEEIRKRGARGPALMMSGFSELHVRERMAAEHCVEFLQKPFDLVSFRAKVEAALARGANSQRAA